MSELAEATLGHEWFQGEGMHWPRCVLCDQPKPRPGELLKPCNPPKDARALLDRLRQRAAETGQRLVAPVATGARPASEVRIDWYVPKRFLMDHGKRREVSLDLCENPDARGRCACPGVRHFIAYTPSQAEAHLAACEWAEQAGTDQGLALALVGGVGTGKSHLLYAAVLRANRRGVNCGAWGWFDLAEVLRAASADTDRDLRTRMAYERDKAKSCAALCIDEIRPTAGTEFDPRQLSNLMTRAYSNCQDVFATSNHAGDGLANIIGMAASSRLTQVQIVGPDHRQPNRLTPYTSAARAA